MHVCGMCKLMLMALARVGKRSYKLRRGSKGCDTYLITKVHFEECKFIIQPAQGIAKILFILQRMEVEGMRNSIFINFMSMTPLNIKSTFGRCRDE